SPYRARASRAAAHLTSARCCWGGSRHGYCLHKRDDRIDLGRLKKILEGRHARSPVKDVLADDAVVAAARGLIQQGTVGLCMACRWQVTDPTRLSQDLAAKPLLVVEAIARLLGERILRASGQQKQEHRGATLHLRFPPNSGF